MRSWLVIVCSLISVFSLAKVIDPEGTVKGGDTPREGVEDPLEPAPSTPPPVDCQAPQDDQESENDCELGTPQ
ncbi:MAG: hypothetical protein HYZ71_10610 [Deltaproteobacteria bacterium]|nr:hypothetical protein [Deltaproteobacteria bacterium]